MEAVADLHLDLLQELLIASDEPNPFGAHWLGQLQAGGVRLQGCPIYVPAEESAEAALRVALRPRLLKDTDMPEGVTLASAVEDLRGPEDFPRLADAMAALGWSTGRRNGVLHDNAVRFLSSALPDG